MTVGNSGISEARVLELLGNLGLGDLGTFTLATLPDPSPRSRRTIWVTDLWSALPVAQQGGRMVSEGGFWKPIRPLVTGSTVSASMATQPLVTPTTLILTAGPAVGITHNITLGTGSGYAVPASGYRQRIVKPTIAFLGSINIVGKLLTGWADFEFDGTTGNWQQTASGGLL